MTLNILNLLESLPPKIILILKNIFPSPGEDVPLADILDFKYKRREELMQFRSVMDKYYRQLSCVRYADELVMASNDIVDDIEGAVKSLTNAMKDARQSIIFNSTELLLHVALNAVNTPVTPSIPLIAINGGRALINAYKCYLSVANLKNISKNSPLTYVLMLEMNLYNLKFRPAHLRWSFMSLGLWLSWLECFFDTLSLL